MLIEMRFRGDDLVIQDEVQSFWSDETVYGFSTYGLHLLSGDLQKWDSLVRLEEFPKVQLRWGDEVNGAQRWTNWRSTLLTLKFRYQLESAEVWIEGVDAGYVFAERCHGLNFRDKTISHMVAEIASVNNFESSITSTTGRYTMYQGRLSDYEFLLSLLSYAVSTDKRYDFVCFVLNGDRLAFGTPDLSQIFARYQFSSRPEDANLNDMEHWDVETRSVHSREEHSLLTEIRDFDRFEKKPVFYYAGDETADFKYLARYRPSSQSVPGVIRLASIPEHVEEEGKSRWSRHARSFYRSRCEIAYDYRAVPSAIVDVSVRDRDAAPHWSTGRWYVWKVRHWYRPRGERTVLFMERRSRER